jgi:hypothetical protein
MPLPSLQVDRMRLFYRGESQLDFPNILVPFVTSKLKSDDLGLILLNALEACQAFFPATFQPEIVSDDFPVLHVITIAARCSSTGLRCLRRESFDELLRVGNPAQQYLRGQQRSLMICPQQIVSDGFTHAIA